MKKYTDKELANFLLESRQNGPAASWPFKKHWWRWTLFIALTALLVGVGLFVHSGALCGFIIGLVAGGFSRDRTWLQGRRAVWPFYAKIIDWPKVGKIASGEEPVAAP